MRIGFDAKRMFHNNTGLGNYARNTIRNLIKYHPELSPVLFTPDVHPEWEWLAEYYKDILVQGPKLFPRIWRTVGMKQPMMDKNISIYHGLSSELPYIPSENRPYFVVTIHDLIFIQYPEYYPLIDRTIYRQKMRSACKRADKIIATSEVTKRNIIDIFEIRPDKISVIYQDCSEIYQEQRNSVEHPDLQARTPETFLLCVASFEKRKNHINLLKAFKQVRDQVDYKLVLAGRPKDTYEDVVSFIEENNLTADVIMFDDLSDSEIKQLMDQARAFVFPSIYEGFGIPVLEALYGQNVILTSENSSMEEVAGDAGIYFDPMSVDSIADKLLMALPSNKTFTKAWESIPERLNRMSPGRITSELYDVYRAILQQQELSQI